MTSEEKIDQIITLIQHLSRTVDALEQNLVSIRFHLDGKTDIQRKNQHLMSNPDFAKELAEIERLTEGR